VTGPPITVTCPIPITLLPACRTTSCLPFCNSSITIGCAFAQSFRKTVADDCDEG
jgi:hypothetical protein